MGYSSFTECTVLETKVAHEKMAFLVENHNPSSNPSILLMVQTAGSRKSHQKDGFLKANLGGGFKYFLFSPLLGEMIQFY